MAWAKQNQFEWIYPCKSAKTCWSLPDNSVRIKTKKMGEEINHRLKTGNKPSLSHEYVDELAAAQVRDESGMKLWRLRIF